MRKLIAGLLAVTALIPAAASAQEGRRGPRAEGQARGEFRGGRDGAGGEVRGGVRAEIPRERWDGPRPFRGARPDGGPRLEDGGARRGRPDGTRFGSRPDRGPAVDVNAGVGIGDGRPDRSRFGDSPDRGLDARAGIGIGRTDRPDRDRFDGRPGPGIDAGRADRARLDRARADRVRGDRDLADWGRSDWGRSDWAGNDRNRSRFNDRGGFGDWRGDRGGGWNRGWRQDRRYDWNGYRGSNRAAYRLPRYYAPYGQGLGYRRFGVGVGLQSAFWGSNYWIADPFAYRLPPADGPYRWVRYYDDALLIDLRSGVVVDAVYDIFW